MLSSLRRLCRPSIAHWRPSRTLSTQTSPPWDQSQHNELHKLISKVIGFTGPLPLSQYMRQCLTHPQLGYYTSRDPLGAEGDFITSPEISQMFGEMLGMWFYTAWALQGKPYTVNFVEFGPGKGTLLFDVMRSFSNLCDKRKDSVSTNVVLVEASHILRQKQAAKIGSTDVDASGEYWLGQHRWCGSITWCDTDQDVYQVTHDTDTNFIIAHEFFDALPINKFKKTDQGWREVYVDQHPDTGEFVLVQSSKETATCSIPKSQHRYNSVPVNSIVEISPETYQYSKVIADLITRNEKGTGAAIVVDYGPSVDVPSNTLRGIKDHKIVSPFKQPGEVDLSVDVDFQAIANAAIQSSKVDILGPVEQGDFLQNMGMETRLKQLQRRSSSQEEMENLEQSYKRLVQKDEGSMGKIYKFMGIVPQGVAVPVGFKP